MANGMTEDLAGCGAIDLAQMITTGLLSPVEVVQAALARLDAVEPRINAFSCVLREQALAEARQAERRLSSGDELPPLFGVPVSIKDLIAVRGAPLSFGSRALSHTLADNIRGQHSEIDAVAVERLRAAGAIILGKTTTSELGGKAVGDSPLTGITRSPWDLTRTAGGSSAGAAASVAAGVTPIALGTDGGGSIRIPAALNGLFGFKAQFGRVPVFPASATPDLAHVAPIGRSVRDVALMLDVIAGHDPRDPSSLMARSGSFLQSCEQRPARLRIAWSPTFGYARPQADVMDVATRAIKTLERMGADVELIERPIGDDPADSWTLQFYANIAVKLAGLDHAQRERLDPALRQQMESASRADAAMYCHALAERRRVQQHLHVLFERFDVLISPTLPVSSVQVGLDVPLEMIGRNPVTWACYTYPFNLSGHPAASIPAGIGATGHPIGLQMVGKPQGERQLLSIAAAFEAARPWPLCAPVTTQSVTGATPPSVPAPRAPSTPPRDHRPAGRW